jgi:hypothetical protein
VARDDESGRNRPADDGGLPQQLRIPDDARELDADRRAWLRERRARAVRAAVRRGLFTRRWHRYGLSGPLVVAVLTVVGILGGLAVVFVPHGSPRTAPAPLAAADVPPGRPGGLLPDGPLELVPGGPAAARMLRPAVLAVVPAHCGCPQTLDHVMQEAELYRLRTWLVGGPERRTDLVGLAQHTGNGTAGVAVDVNGQIARTYAPHGVTVVLVHTDGVVGAVLRDVAPQTGLARQLAALLTRGRRP